MKGYCYLVASTEGLMLFSILSTKHHENLKEEAIVPGIAMQITNILRDIGEDHPRDRIYLPESSFNTYPHALTAIQHKQNNPYLIQFWEHW